MSDDSLSSLPEEVISWTGSDIHRMLRFDCWFKRNGVPSSQNRP